MNYIINFIIGFLGIVSGTLLSYYLDKLKRKEKYRELMFNRRIDIYSGVMEKLSKMDTEVHNLRDINLLNKKLVYYRNYFEDLIWAKSIFISAKVKVAISDLLDNLIIKVDKLDELGGFDGLGFIEIRIDDITRKIENEISSSKILDNRDFKKILKGKDIETQYNKISSERLKDNK